LEGNPCLVAKVMERFYTNILGMYG